MIVRAKVVTLDRGRHSFEAAINAAINGAMPDEVVVDVRLAAASVDQHVAAVAVVLFGPVPS